MVEKMIIYLDYEVLVAKSLHTWDGVANYRPEVLSSMPGDTILKIVFVPIGELGTVEIMKEINGCTVIFSEVTVIENFNDLIKQMEQKINETAQPFDEMAFQFGNMMNQRWPEEGLLKAKQEQWQETKDMYRLMIKELQAKELEIMKPGRKTKAGYDAAFLLIKQGKKTEEAYQYWKKNFPEEFEDSKEGDSSPYDRFRTAMKRRRTERTK